MLFLTQVVQASGGNQANGAPEELDLVAGKNYLGRGCRAAIPFLQAVEAGFAGSNHQVEAPPADGPGEPAESARLPPRLAVGVVVNQQLQICLTPPGCPVPLRLKIALKDHLCCHY